VTAIDITPSMVQRTQQRAQLEAREVTTAVMNAHSLGFPSATFDCVLLHLVLAVVPDPISCIQEASRVLKFGGKVSIFDKFLSDDTTPSPLRRALNVVTNTAFSDITRQLGPLLQQTSLTIYHEESAGFGGTYQIVQAINAASIAPLNWPLVTAKPPAERANSPVNAVLL
jgi:ubiquinone/menaquinone biosynthesis C-methylase UbiE